MNNYLKMEKLILILVLFVALPIGCAAQGSDGNFLFGFKAGANYSNVYDSKSEEFEADPKFGLATGAFLHIPIGRFIGIQPEILFSQKGFKATGNLLGGPYAFTRTTNYIDVPIFFALKPISGLTVLAGPQYSYLAKRKDVFSDGSTSIVQEEEIKRENIRKNTLCFVGGVDLIIEHIVIGVRAGWDVQSNNGDGTSSTPRYKNTWLQATLGFKI